MHGRQMLHPLPAVIVARGCLYLGTEILTRPAPGVQATCPPLSCRRGAVVTCSRTIYPTAAQLQVRACLVVLGTGMGGGCGRAALCAHGCAMPVTRLRVLLQMPRKRTSGPMLAVAAVSKWASVGVAKGDVAEPLAAAMPRNSPVQHPGDVLHLTRGLSNLRPRPTCSIEGSHAERLREILTCCARQGPLSPTLRVQEGALHELETVVRGDAQAQVHHGW